MLNILTFIIFYTCNLSLAESSKLELKSFDKKDCQNYKNGGLANWKFDKENLQASWVNIKTDAKKANLISHYKCTNSKERKLSLDIGAESGGGSSIFEIRCDMGFVIERRVGNLGEGGSNNYISLNDCDEFGSGDSEMISPNKKFLILSTDADVEAGYNSDSGLFQVLDCKYGSCKKILEKSYKNEGFSNSKWANSTTFKFERTNLVDALNDPGKVKSIKCVLNLEKNVGLNCK
ncbi:MAG: hypothetical protein ACK4VO_07490 [Pseudobdellovibrio sp.]